MQSGKVNIYLFMCQKESMASICAAPACWMYVLWNENVGSVVAWEADSERKFKREIPRNCGCNGLRKCMYLTVEKIFFEKLSAFFQMLSDGITKTCGCEWCREREEQHLQSEWTFYRVRFEDDRKLAYCVKIKFTSHIIRGDISTNLFSFMTL